MKYLSRSNIGQAGEDVQIIFGKFVFKSGTMKKILYYALALTVLMMSVWGCKEDPVTGDDKDPVIPHETLVTNEWIRDNMELYYFWNDKLPGGIEFSKEPDSEAYFYKLVYKEKDKWSRITSDYKALEAELAGKPVTMGYNPSFFLVGNNKIVIAVKYVYPGSPAADAGLERGDIILTIDNTALDTSNYYDLYSGPVYSVQLGRLEGNTLLPTGESVSMTARVTNTNPSIHHEVLDIDGHKIGYLVYVEFIAGESDVLLTEMDNIFNEFKAAGVSDLIIDFRYNPGGEISAAVHLASIIGPAEVANRKDVLISLKYNEGLDSYLRTSNLTNYLSYKFETTSANIDMDRVYFLTTSGTASASELVIVGLEPYMDVIKIGEPTYGKYAGAWVMPDDAEKWAIIPIVSKFANADGYTDFVYGLPPDYEIDDDLMRAVPFGDTRDPMLAKAIELATGKSGMAKSYIKTERISFPIMVPEEMKLKSNLYLDGFAPEAEAVRYHVH